MATKSKTATKKKSSSKSVQGSGGLKSKKFNWKTMILLVLPIALIGGFFVFKSNAATGTVWNVKKNNPNPVSNWGGKFPKDDGSQGWDGGAGNWIKIRATFTSANINNKTYCAEGKYIGTDWRVTTSVAYSNGGKPASRPDPVNTGGDGWKACTTAHSTTQPGDWIELYICGRSSQTTGNACTTTSKVTGSIKVQNFYRP